MKAVFWGQVGGRGVYTPLDRVQSCNAFLNSWNINRLTVALCCNPLCKAVQPCNSLGLVHPSQFDEFPPSLPLPNSGNGLLRPPPRGLNAFPVHTALH